MKLVEGVNRDILLKVYRNRCQELQDSLVLQQAQSVELLSKNEELEKVNSELHIELENLRVRLNTLESSEN